MTPSRIRKAPGPIPVPLIVHSAFSLGRGTASPEALLERACACGLEGLALTDRDNLYAAVGFLKGAARVGIHPVLGAEVTARESPPAAPGPAQPRGVERGACRPFGAVVLLIREPAGYASLCRIVTARHLAPSFDLAAVVARHAEGLAVLVREAATLERIAPLLPAGALYAAVVRPEAGVRGDGERCLREAARSFGCPVVGTVEVYVATPEEVETHRLLAAVRELELVSRLRVEACAPEGSHLPEPGEIFALFADDPGSLAAARELALSCRFGAGDLPAPGSLLPRLPLPSGETAYDRLYRMTQEGLRRRYRRITREAAVRLAWELEQIDRQGFTDYFVVVGDLCAAARARGIPTVGRGSGASSIVSYLLGITNVDPIRYGLTFERFLHRLRRDLPDLDIDLCWRRRDEMIEHVYATYGADRVAMISTQNHYQPRGALREAARAVGLPGEEIDRLARAIPSFTDLPVASAIRSTPLGRALDLETPPVPEALRGADRLLGLPHTLGIHCGGIVIGPGPLDASVPLETATKGIVVTQYEMRAIEAVGLVKIDLLGNRALSTIAETCRTIGSHGGEPPDLDRIDHNDRPTARLLEAGATLGCFQIESPGMRNLLRMLRTCDLDGTIAALSLIRPGPAGSGMKERFVRRARGLEPASYLHPSLEPLLSATHGILLYEEDVLCVASTIGGFDRAVGDLLRRAIQAATAAGPDPALGERAGISLASEEGAGRDDPWRGGSLRELENRFIARAVGNGIAPDVARAVWNELARFGSYAFCKAHASGYGLLAYQTAYLKARHPGPFAASLLNNHQGMYPLWVHVEEARRRGVPLAPPCVHRSAEGWSWDGEHLRCGLGQIKGLSRRTLDAILSEREHGAFEEIEDLLARTGASLPEAEALALSGALDPVGSGPRPRRLWRLHCLARSKRGGRGPISGRLVLDQVGETDSGPWRPFDLEQRVAHELETLEVAISAHPVGLLRSRLARQRRLPELVEASRLGCGGEATLLGMVAATRRVRTKRGETMLFLTLDDPSGLAECILFPPAYARLGARITGGAILLAGGTVEAPYGAPSLTVERLERIEALDGP